MSYFPCLWQAATSQPAPLQSFVPLVSGAFKFIPIAIGDINGDGLEDLLLCDYDIAGINRYLFLGRIGTDTNLSVTAEADATFDMGTNNSFGAALGDLNRDGYDDFALFRTIEVDGPNQGSAFIFYGSAVYRQSAELARTTADAAFRIQMKPTGSLAGGLAALAKPMSITAGDFNGDRKLDLAVSVPSFALNDDNGIALEQRNIGQVAIFWSVAQRIATGGQTTV